MDVDLIECNGVRIPHAPDIVSRRIQRSLSTGRYERIEASAVRNLVQPGDRIVELGAGIGYLSTLALNVAEGVRVVCYEAHPGLARLIGEVHALNGVSDRAEVVNAVLAGPGAPAALPFYIRQHFWSSSLDPEREGVVETVEVPTAPLGEAMAHTRPDLVICDIEGAEAELIPAADFTGVRQLVLELHSARIGLPAVGAIFAHMAGQGLVYDPVHSRGEVVVFTRAG